MNKRITMKRINGRRITTIQTPTSYLCISKAEAKQETTKQDLFKELGIEMV
jgi:hypothetical protein